LTRKFAHQRLRRAIRRSFLHPAVLAAIRRSGRNKSGSAVGDLKQQRPKYGNSQSALAAVLRDVDFRGLLAFHGLRGTVWIWICGIRFRMEQLSRAKLLSAAIAVFAGILLEVFGFGIWIVVASWIFGSPVQYR
jgi:hypothetical protein